MFSDECSVISIGNNAFSFCIRLESIIIPKLVKSLGDYAFHKCEKLKFAKFFDECSVISIGNNAFSFCNNLESITIPKLLKSIENNTFSRCKKLTSIIIPTFIESIKNNAFSYSGLQYIKFLNEFSVKSIGSEAFSYCSFKKISLPPSVEQINQRAFYFCSELKTFIITRISLIKSIGESAFGRCSKLQIFVIMKDIKFIGMHAFDQCDQLRLFHYYGKIEPTFFRNSFSGCKNLDEIIVTKFYLNSSFCGIKTRISNFSFGFHF